MIYFERSSPRYRKVQLEAVAGRCFHSLLGRFTERLSGMQKRRILIVDNNDELRAILENALGSLGHEAVVTGDRDEALSRNDLDQFDVIISDLTEDAPSSDQPGDKPESSNGDPPRDEHRRHLLTSRCCQRRRADDSEGLSKWSRQTTFDFPTTKTSFAR